MATKKISLLSGVALFAIAMSFGVYSIFSYGNEPLKSYQKHARDAEFILIGTVKSVNYEKGYFGQDSGGDVYLTYQYVTLDIEQVIKGNPSSNLIIFKERSEFMDDLKFLPEERVLVMLRWYEDGRHGNYYAQKSSVGKFSIITRDYLNSNETFIENKWHLPVPDGTMKLQDFLLDIQ